MEHVAHTKRTRNIHIFLVEQSTESGHLERQRNLRGRGVDSVWRTTGNQWHCAE